jgi:hypothetical protein
MVSTIPRTSSALKKLPPEVRLRVVDFRFGSGAAASTLAATHARSVLDEDEPFSTDSISTTAVGSRFVPDSSPSSLDRRPNLVSKAFRSLASLNETYSLQISPNVDATIPVGNAKTCQTPSK